MENEKWVRGKDGKILLPNTNERRELPLLMEVFIWLTVIGLLLWLMFG